MIYSYKGIDKSGKNVKAKIEASSLEDAKSKLKSKKIIYTGIKEDALPFSNIKFQKRYKIKPIELANISRDISIYLNAGVSLINAIKLISIQYKNNKKLSAFFESVSTNLNEGKNFF